MIQILDGCSIFMFKWDSLDWLVWWLDKNTKTYSANGDLMVMNPMVKSVKRHKNKNKSKGRIQKSPIVFNTTMVDLKEITLKKL